MPLNTIPNKGLTSRGYPSDRIVTPLIINGDMSIAQRGTSFSGLGNGDSKYTLDRMYFAEVGTPTYDVTIAQDTTVPTGQGFSNSLKLTVQTAETIGAGNGMLLIQNIEAQNLQHLKYGTSNAESITLSFWVRSSETGTAIARLRQPDNSDKQQCQSYTISSANTWEKKTLTFTGDTSGVINNDNGSGLQLGFWLNAGSNFTSGTLPTTWTAYSNADSAAGQTINVTSSTSSDFYITGIQLEVGEFDSTTIPSFPFESFDSNLKRCQRYLQVLGEGTYTDTSVGGNRIAIGQRDGSGSTSGYPIVPTQCQMRATPSITHNNVNLRQDGTNYTLSSINTIKNFGMTIGFNIVSSAALNTGESFQLRTTDANGYMRFDAEL